MVFRKSPTITKRTRRKVWRGMPWRALMTTRDGPGSWLSAGGGPVQGRHIVVLIRGRDHLDDGLHGQTGAVADLPDLHAVLHHHDAVAEPYQLIEVRGDDDHADMRSEEHTSELQSRGHLV